MVSYQLSGVLKDVLSILGVRRMGRRPDQQGPTGSQQQGGQGEGRPPTERRTDQRRPPRERRFDKPGDEKPAEGGEFSVEK